MRVFIGVDPRDPVSYNVLHWSIARRASRPVSITPLVLPQLPLTRRGLTEFTYSRYLVPSLCGFSGKALFMDSDMLCLADLRELFALQFLESVAVVKSAQRFEWPSLMLFNCDQCRDLTVQYVNDETSDPAALEWGSVSALPVEWNHCVGYDEPKDAKIVHFTAGTPAFKERRNCEYSHAWHAEYSSMIAQVSWLEIHGHSVHRPLVLNELGLL